MPDEARVGLELPEPPRGLLGHLRAIGPGLIMASLAIGAGEWILFTALVAIYGPGLMWAAVVGCIVQAVLAVESMKYTVYTGQPIQSAYMKLGKPALWAWLWSILVFVPVVWPGWAVASATAIAALQLGRLPGPGDSGLLLTWTIALLVLGLIILHVGRKVERTLELVSWPIVIAILALVAIAVALAAPVSAWVDVIRGIFVPTWPRGVDWFVFSAAVAFIPAGFGFHLMLSSYARDKGWGMASRAGYIPSMIGGKVVRIATDDFSFAINPENLRRWRGWLNTLRIESWLVFSFTTFLTVLMTSVMTYAILAPQGLRPTGFAVAAVQAEGLAGVLGPAAWFIVLFAGFLILFGTQVGLMDAVTRVIVDSFILGSERVRRIVGGDPRRLYYPVLYMIFVVAVVIAVGSLALGWAQPYVVVAMSANLGLAALFLAYPLQIIVNYKLLPRELRPHPVITALLAAGAIWYGVFLVGLILQTIFGIRL